MNAMDQLVNFLSEGKKVEDKDEKKDPKYAKADKGKSDDGKGLDKPGKEDSDVDNDGDSDKSDDYLKNRRNKVKDEVDTDEKDKSADIEKSSSKKDDKKSSSKDDDDDGDYEDNEKSKKPKGKKDKVEMEPEVDERDDVSESISHTSVMNSISFLFSDNKRDATIRNNRLMENMIPSNASPEQKKHITAYLKGAGSDDKKNKAAISAIMSNVSEAKNIKPSVGDRPRKMSIENDRFWDLPDASLAYIAKDSAKASKGNPDNPKNTSGPGNYADQIADSATVRAWRSKEHPAKDIVFKKPMNEAKKLPPHLAKFVDKDGNMEKDAEARVLKGRAKDGKKSTVKDVTPKGYGPTDEETELDDDTLTEMKHKSETIISSIKNKKKGFEKRYGDKAESIMYAMANKLALKEGFEISEEMFNEAGGRMVKGQYYVVAPKKSGTQQSIIDGPFKGEDDAVETGREVGGKWEVVKDGEYIWGSDDE